MGKAMNKMNALKQRRNEVADDYEHIMNMFGYAMSPEYVRLNESNYQMSLACLDREIREAEAAALEERAQEIAASMLGDITNQATRAGKEFAAAFQNGLNGR